MHGASRSTSGGFLVRPLSRGQVYLMVPDDAALAPSQPTSRSMHGHQSRAPPLSRPSVSF